MQRASWHGPLAHPALDLPARTRRSAKSNVFLRGALIALFFITLASSIYTVKLGLAGLPIRAFTGAFILLLAAVFRPAAITRVLSTFWPGLAIITALATIGVISSIAYGTEPLTIARQVLEIHVQAIIGLIIGAVLIQICGPRPLVMVAIFVIGLSAVVAALQFLNFSPAWDLRERLAQFQPVDMAAEAVVVGRRERALGLSYSPVHLGTQLCLLFATTVALSGRLNYSRFMSGFDLRVVFSVAFLVGASVLAGNRSPLLGVVVFCGAYLALTRPVLTLPVIIVVMPALFLLEDLLDFLVDSGLRIARTEDSSSLGRRALQIYGLNLFIDRPMGYGLAFNSTGLWQGYWEEVRLMENPLIVSRFVLHNYYLMMLNKYGLLLIPIIVVIAKKIWKDKIVFLSVIPYAVHVFYHNDGPLQGDFLIWFLIPIWLVPAQALRMQVASKQTTLTPPLRAGK